MPNKSCSKRDLLSKVIQGIDSVKGENITVLDLQQLENSVCTYFVICDGTSNIHVKSICNSVEKTVRSSLKQRAWHVEGLDNAQWVLVDYVHIVVHIFQKHIRDYYNIEDLWGDTKELPLEEFKSTIS